MFTAQSDAKLDLKTAAGIWLFDEGAGNDAKDSSKKGNHGKLMKGPKWVEGKIGSALGFDGTDDCVLIPSSPGDSLNPSSQVTIAAWIKRNTNDPSTSSDLIVGRMDTVTTRTYYLAFYQDKIQMEVSQDGTTGGREYDESSSTITDTKWHHVAGTFDGKEIKLYIDGVYDCEKTPTGNVTSINKNDSDVYIGYDKVDNAFYFNGAIDEVAIFNVALIDSDIELIMKKGLKPLAAVSPAGKLATAWGAIKNKD